eukprot:TRINITY_DN2740_c0_g1_i3.p1 TRINITY_DN2740_c0_g1~~TRINITY_DN2740_c0_g1_i3.p1  ORF type:complete len:204 (-),score=29.41 TRINITY_DN2740_c0_g1_i3:95-706(-)
MRIVYLLLDYHPGTLQSWINTAETPISQKEVMEVFKGVCEGINFLHLKNPALVHRDLKPDNVLISDDRRPVLVDLGSVAEARVTISSRTDALRLQEHCDLTCSPLYRAPELFEVETGSVIDERTDVWSLGCLLYYMVFSKSPFDHVVETGGSVKLAALSGQVHYPPTRFSEELVNFIKKMIEPVQFARPFVSDLLLEMQRFGK